MHVKDILVRVIIGGAVVSVFALLGELLKPKSFAGLFGAAPSVSLATLALTVAKEGKAYASLEARSMLLGSIAFIIVRRRNQPRYDASSFSSSVSHHPGSRPLSLWYVILRVRW